MNLHVSGEPHVSVKGWNHSSLLLQYLRTGIWPKADEGRHIRRELELKRRRDLEVEERLKEELESLEARED